MKLDRLELSQWQSFREPFVMDGLEEGINLFVGPNATGKSTLVGAIQAAFFERHKSSTLDYLQPRGDSAADPAVSLSFQWQGQQWQLEKRFLRHPRCDLHIDGEHFSGDEAEEKLADLMGYSFAGRGASKPEHHGIPGLLWVQQGAIQELRGPVEYAGQYLQAAMGEELGAVTGSSGDWVLARVTQLRGELLTKTGRATGDNKAIAQELDTAADELRELDARVRVYEDKVDELSRLQQQQDDDTDEPWLEQRRKAGEARSRLDDIDKLRKAQEQAEGNLEECARHQKLVRDKLQGFEKATDQLAKRASERAAAEARLDDFLARQPAVEKRRDQAKAAHEMAAAAFKQARQQAHRARLEEQRDRLAEAVQARQKTLDQLKALREQLRALRDQRQQQSIDADGLDKLKKLQKTLDKLALRKEVAATRLRWNLEPDQELKLDGETIRGEDQRQLLEAAELVIPGVGTLQLLPGGKDLAELARQQAHHEDDRDALLLELDIKDLAEGQQRAAACGKLDAEIQRVEDRIDTLAPDGLDELADRQRLDKNKRAQLAEEIEGCPPATSDAPDETRAEQARDDAQAALEAADEAARSHQQESTLARQALEQAADEWQQLESQCEDPQRKADKEEASQNLTDLRARARSLQHDIDQRRSAIDKAQPEALEDDIRRFTASADALETAARKRERSIYGLQRELEALGAQGLDEKRGELQQRVERLERRHAELERRARALDFLLERLQAGRQALTRSLQAPLQKHLDRYLKLLFPEASLQVDESLLPSVLVQGGQRGDLHEQSYGTREQMGLVSRAAYADLLKEADQPTLLILDDALVNTDHARLDRMKRVLFEAAKRHQILLFTCHPHNWNDLGVAARDLQTMKTTSGGST